MINSEKIISIIKEEIKNYDQISASMKLELLLL